MLGFYEDENIQKIKPVKKANNKKIIGCESCAAYKSCNSPKMGVTGNGDKGILIIGPKVSRREDKDGKLYGDLKGQYLKEKLSEINIDLERDCWYLPIVQCYSKKLTPQMIEGCRLRMDHTIKKLKPKKILILGEDASNSFLQERIEKSRIGSGNMERFLCTEKAIPDQLYNSWVVFNYDPKFVVDALIEKKEKLEKYGRYHNRKKEKLWHHRQLIKDDMFRIRDLYFKKHLKKILIKEEFKRIDYKKQCEYIDNVDEAIGVMRLLLKSPTLGYDTETNAKYPYAPGAKLLTIAFHTLDMSFAFAPYPENKVFMRLFKKLLTSKNIGIKLANYQFEDSFVRELFGFSITNCIVDTVLASHILYPTVKANSNLKVCSYRTVGYLGYDENAEQYIKSVDKENPFSLNQMEEMDPEERGIYCCLDATFTDIVGEEQLKEINSNEKLRYIYNLYHEGQIMYSDMSFYGTAIDEEQLLKNEKDLEEMLYELQYKIENCEDIKTWYKERPNEKFNYNSNDQLKILFFDMLGLSTNKRTARGGLSVDADVLESLSNRSDLAKLLTEYKQIYKLLNTDLNNIKKFTVNGRIHPQINLTTASTGRSACSQPNLQNIAGFPLALKMIKSCFIAEEGMEFGAWDFTSLEVITSVGITKDKTMIAELSDPSIDSHTLMTKQFFGEDLETPAKFMMKVKGETDFSEDAIKHFIKSEMRQPIKSGNFALQYLASPNRIYTTLFVESFKSYHLAWFKHIGIGDEKSQRELCAKIYAYYWERYKDLRAHIDKVWEEYLTKGETYSIFGFRYNMINGRTFMANSFSQGAGLVIALLGNLHLWKKMKGDKRKSRLTLSVHDSTEVQIDPEEFFDGGFEQDVQDSFVTYLNRKLRWLEIPLGADIEYYDGSWGTECKREVWEERYNKEKALNKV